MQPGWESSIAALLGEGGLTRLVAAFYRRVEADDLLGPMYRESLAGGETMEHARDRLRGFLAFRLGVSDAYVRERGHPRLRARHMRFPVDRAAAERWIRLMGESVDELGLTPAATASLRAYFSDTAMFMVNR